MKPQTQWASVQYDMIQLGGGMDQTTPGMLLKPGVCRDALNYECSISGGYSRIGGYERFSGRTSPSTAVFSVVPVTITGSVTVGFILLDVDSFVEGYILAFGPDFIVIASTNTDNFNVGDQLEAYDPNVGPTGDIIGTVADSSSYLQNPLTTARYNAAAADHARDNIFPPGGSGDAGGMGPTLGVAMLNGEVFAWREEEFEEDQFVKIYRATESGWEVVPYFLELEFDTGTSELFDGDFVDNGSGSSGTIMRVVLESGSWDGGDAAGRLIIDTSDSWTIGDPIEISAVQYATAQSAETPIQPLGGGRYEFAVGNFGGQSGTKKLYGVDGVNRGFEFDGEVCVPINTGMELDQPKHVAIFQNHLFYSFGSSAQHSGIGLPYQWSPLFGAGELAAGDEITGFLVQPGNQSGGAMAFFMRDEMSMLYGTSSADWNLVKFNIGVGSLHYTQQNLTESFFFDDRGIMSMSSTLNYGNFDSASLTETLKPFVSEHRVRACASTVSRDRSQYRLFFNDGYGLYMTVVNGKLLGTMPVFFPDDVYCSCFGEDANGNEVAFFGSSNGYVYQFDMGSSFDGIAINAYFTLVYNHVKSPRILKRYRKASIEITGNFFNQFNFGYKLGYNSLNIIQPPAVEYTADFSVPYWDSVVWDEFTWDGITLSPIECEVAGTAENIALMISSNSAIYYPSTMNTIFLHYTLRRGLR